MARKSSKRSWSAAITSRVEALTHDLHTAYCQASAVEAALLYKDIDLDPEIAVVVKKALVLELDRMHFEAKEIASVLKKVQSQKRKVLRHRVRTPKRRR